MARDAGSACRTAVRATLTPAPELTGMCLRAVRTWLDVPPRDPSAIDAWRSVPKVERRTSSPPAGTPVFWEVGQHGHIALSLGHLLCVSTDILAPGRVSVVPIAEVERRWGAHLLGWTVSLNGVRVPR